MRVLQHSPKMQVLCIFIAKINDKTANIVVEINCTSVFIKELFLFLTEIALENACWRLRNFFFMHARKNESPLQLKFMPVESYSILKTISSKKIWSRNFTTRDCFIYIIYCVRLYIYKCRGNRRLKNRSRMSEVESLEICDSQTRKKNTRKGIPERVLVTLSIRKVSIFQSCRLKICLAEFFFTFLSYFFYFYHFSIFRAE